MSSEKLILPILVSPLFVGCAYNAAMEHERLANTSMSQEMRVVSAENSDLRSERGRLQRQLSQVRASLVSVESKLSKTNVGEPSYVKLQEELLQLNRRKAELERDINALL